MTNLKFLGKGLSYPFKFSGAGAAGTSTSSTESEGVEHVKQALIQLLKTNLGERWMKRDFGSDLQQLVFSPQQETLLIKLTEAIRTAVEVWEKRVEIRELKLLELNPIDGKIVLLISFRIITTNVEGNLVYPFYLQTPSLNTVPPPTGVVQAKEG